jgi:hypothetical protein
VERRVWAVGALTVGRLVAGAGVAAADTADAARFRVTAGPLVLSRDGNRYTGTSQTVDGFQVRAYAANSEGKPADATPTDYVAAVRLALPPA